jgi:hypothetical protein
MHARVSKISLTVFVVLFVLFVVGDLSVAGEAWPWFAVMAIFAVVPIIAGPCPYRIFGVVALVLSVLLIAGDLVAGRLLRERMHQSSVETTHPNPDIS